MGSIINLVILAAVAACILVCSSAIVCESHLRFVGRSDSGSGSFADEICSTWALWMSRILSLILQEDSPSEGTNRRTEGLFVLCVAFPFFLTSTTVYVLSLIQKKKKGNRKHGASLSTTQAKRVGPKLGLGDPLIHWWSFLVLFVPTALICADVLLNPPDNPRFKEMPVLTRSAFLLANPFGVAACISLSFFLVPVARGSYTIEWETDSDGFGWSWSPMHALVFHRWAGWFGAFFTGLHVSIYCLFYILNGMQQSHESPLRILWLSLVPGRECWPLWLPWSPSHSTDSFFECVHGQKFSYDSSNVTMCFDAEHQKKGAFNRCYGHWRNFMGTISALSFLVLCLTSFSFIRRRYYSIFYKTHIIAGSMMLVFAILHFETILMYLFPSMVYYLATTIPTLIQQCVSYKNDGVRIKSIKAVENSGQCFEVTLPMSSVQHQPLPDDLESPNTSIGFSSISTPVYARVCVPSISAIWHPFSVMIKPRYRKDDKHSSSSPTTSASPITRDSLALDEEQISNTDSLLTSYNDNETDHQNGQVMADDTDVVIFFRSIGPFTKAWANSLLSTIELQNTESENNRIVPPKILLLDGFYPGAFPIPKIMRRHDAIFLIAGGVGIVPFVSVLQAWYHFRELGYKQHQRQEEEEDHEQQSDNDHHLPGKVVLYWSCREPGLLNHFLEHHLNFLLQDGEGDSNLDPDRSNLPSVELFCHLTKGGLASPSGQSSLQQPLLSDDSSLQQSLSSYSSSATNQDEEEGTIPSMTGTTCSNSQNSSRSSLPNDNEATNNNHQDLSITNSSHVDGSIQVSRFDWMSFMVFALILWFSFLVQAWQYSRRILVYEETSNRFNSIYITLVWSALVALSGECFRAWYYRKYTLQQHMDCINYHHSRMECHQGHIEEEQISFVRPNSHSGSLNSIHLCDALLPSSSSANATTNSCCNEHTRMMESSFVHRSSVAGITSVHIIYGRPDFQDIIGPIGNSECPAVLLCGPHKLRENVRYTVLGDSQCARKCSIYEEVSEM